MKLEGFDHVGILTEDFEPVRHLFGELLGATLEGPYIEAEVGIEILWVRIGEVDLEFIRPIDPDSRAAQVIRDGGVGVHHVAVRVTDIDEAFREVHEDGLATVTAQPRSGARGSRIGFLDPRLVAGAQVELVQRPPDGGSPRG